MWSSLEPRNNCLLGVNNHPEKEIAFLFPIMSFQVIQEFSGASLRQVFESTASPELQPYWSQIDVIVLIDAVFFDRDQRLHWRESPIMDAPVCYLHFLKRIQQTVKAELEICVEIKESDLQYPYINWREAFNEMHRFIHDNQLQGLKFVFKSEINFNLITNSFVGSRLISRAYIFIVELASENFVGSKDLLSVLYYADCVLFPLQGWFKLLPIFPSIYNKDVNCVQAVSDRQFETCRMNYVNWVLNGVSRGKMAIDIATSCVQTMFSKIDETTEIVMDIKENTRKSVYDALIYAGTNVEEELASGEILTFVDSSADLAYVYFESQTTLKKKVDYFLKEEGLKFVYLHDCKYDFDLIDNKSLFNFVVQQYRRHLNSGAPLLLQELPSINGILQARRIGQELPGTPSTEEQK